MNLNAAPSCFESRLRPYQEELLARIRRAFAAGDGAVMATLATGGGKTAIAARWASAQEGQVLFCCASLEVVAQAHDEFGKWGVLASGSPPADFTSLAYSPAIKVIAAHRATCANRVLKAKRAPAFAALIIDEAHHATDGGNLTSRLVRHFRERGKPVLGITATCWRMSRKEGFEKTWSRLVQGPDWATLAREGYLADIDLRQIAGDQRILGGDLNALGEYTDSGIIASNSENPIFTGGGLDWLQECAPPDGDGRLPSTIIYAVGQEHALHISRLAAERGIRAGLLVSSADIRGRAEGVIETERRRAIAAFRNRELDALINVNMVTEGFDCPSSEAILCLRPTKSLALWLQICGRGSRREAGKDAVLILDAAGNAAEHGSPFRAHDWSLEARGAGAPQDGPSRLCVSEDGASCGAMLHPSLRKCPECGAAQGKQCPTCGKHRIWEKHTRTAHLCDQCLSAVIIAARRKGAKPAFMRGCAICGDMLAPKTNKDNWKKVCGRCWGRWRHGKGGYSESRCGKCLQPTTLTRDGEPHILCPRCRRSPTFRRVKKGKGTRNGKAPAAHAPQTPEKTFNAHTLKLGSPNPREPAGGN